LKKIVSLALIAALLLSAAACGKAAVPRDAESTELIVFAAASMTETLTEIAALYKARAPGVKLVFNFDSSGTLLTQIQAGADCNVFISAAQKQMDALDGAGLLPEGSRFDLVENEVVLVVPKGNPANIHSFADAAKAGTIALGNADVPAGQYAEEIFRGLGLWDDEFLSRVTLASNVKEVAAWVSEGAADCGVVYLTDAKAAGLLAVAAPPPGTLQSPVRYPAAVLGASKNAEAANAFLAFLRTEAAGAVFEGAGFTIPE